MQPSLFPRTLRHCLLPCGLLLAAATGRAQSSPERVVVTAPAGLTAQEVVQRAVANDERRHQHRLPMECDQTLTTERLDDHGNLLKTKTVRLVHREGAEFAYFSRNDSPALQRASRDGDTVKAEHALAVMNLARLAPRFDYTLSAGERVQGRACYVVAFAPRRGQRPGTPEEKVIDQLHGRFWIDEKTFEIVQGEGALAAPVGVGPLAFVEAMSFSLRNGKGPDGEPAPADFRVDYVVKAPFYFYHQRQANRLENWRRARE